MRSSASTADVAGVVRLFAESLRPPEAMNVDEWAPEKRRLTPEVAADAGPWRNAKTPYLVGIMRALSPTDPTPEVVFMKPSRVGGTEAMNNAAGAYMDAVKCPIMVVQPTEADAEEWSKDHLDAMIRSTPSLDALIARDSGQRTKGNTILHKKYKGGTFYVAGASTPKSFRRRTARLVLMDEIDAYPGNLDGEGDPVGLARNRTETYTWNKKVFLCSTPTIKGASRIEKAFLESDQRYYMVPCPECGHKQRLVWQQVKWTGALDEDGNPDAEYCCIECGSLIPHRKKPWMMALENGAEWVATAESAKAGFHLSTLYSPWMTWAQMAREFLDKKDDPVQLQVFVNTKLGETWDLHEADSWDTDSLMKLVEPMAPLPSRVSCITAGVDTQADMLVMQVDAWGPGEERWTIERRDILGDPSGPAVWQELERALLSEYPLEAGGVAGIQSACIDSGGHHTLEVYRFCRANRRRKWWAIKGSNVEGRGLWPRAATRSNKGKVALHILGVDAGKEACHGRLRRSEEMARGGRMGGPSYWHFLAGQGIDQAYFDELTNETCVVLSGRGARARSGRKRQWFVRNPRIRNESLDISVYSLAALHGLISKRNTRLDVPLIGREPTQRPKKEKSGGHVESFKKEPAPEKRADATPEPVPQRAPPKGEPASSGFRPRAKRKPKY